MKVEYTERQIEIMFAAAKRIDEHGIQDLTIKTLSADLGLSEAALYRHFKSKNEILLGLLTYFIAEMRERLAPILLDKKMSAIESLVKLFRSQLKAFVERPSIVSVIFSEGIFQFNKELADTVASMMEMMQKNVEGLIKKGQMEGTVRKNITPSSLTTIITGGMRMTVLKWKLSGHKSNLMNDGITVLNDIIKLMEV